MERKLCTISLQFSLPSESYILMREKNFYTEYLIHTSFSNKLFYEEFQTYRELFVFLSCSILLCKLLIFRKTWLYTEGEGKKLEMYI